MSMSALRWVRRLRAAPTHKLILWALADMANDHLECWPSMAGLVEATGLTDRTIQTAIPRLAENGLIEVDRSRGGRSNVYRLTLAEPRTPFGVRAESNPEAASPNPEAASPETPKLFRLNPEAASGGTPNNPQREPKENPTRAKRASVTSLASAVSVVLPNWLPADAWDAWCAHRIRKSRKGWTQGAAEWSIRELGKCVAQGDDAREVIERSIGSGWTGLFPSKNGGGRAATSTLLDATIQRQLERRQRQQENPDDDE